MSAQHAPSARGSGSSNSLENGRVAELDGSGSSNKAALKKQQYKETAKAKARLATKVSN